ncbi:MAG: hypothetical protein GF320_21935 [Armatimonadia bacterium]|nr:hypothetical protein [Armatimonadia bacterium]
MHDRDKDTALVELAKDGFNVAQFISWSPGVQRHSAIRGFPLDHPFDDVRALLEVVGSVNLRTWRHDRLEGCPFIYGVDKAPMAHARIEHFGHEGYRVIANETIDVNDGGVSGVTHGDVTEFAPNSTPRCVEEGDAARLPTVVAWGMLHDVYGTIAPIPIGSAAARYEWSVHPQAVGYHQRRHVIWQRTDADPPPCGGEVGPWPNAFSRFIGDKAYGLMVASRLGAMVPRTRVITRGGLVFAFGPRPGRREDDDIRPWWRTCPRVREPGRHPTWHGYETDPIAMLGRLNSDVASVLIQEPIPAEYSGAASWRPGEPVLIEGVEGEGEDYMLGQEAPTELPGAVVEQVERVVQGFRHAIESGEIEWVRGSHGVVVVVQLHSRVPDSMYREVEESWKRVHPGGGIRAVRSAAEAAQREGVGVALTRPVGRTSHMAQILDRAEVPWGVSTAQTLEASGEGVTLR